MSIADNVTPSPRPSARPALVALGAVVLYWLAETLGQIAYLGWGGEISIWGIQTALGQSAVVVICLFLAHALVRRMDVLLRNVTLIFLFGALLNALIWGWISVSDGDWSSPDAWYGLRTLSLLPQIMVLIWLMRAGWRHWAVSGLVVTLAFLGAQEIVSRYFYVQMLYFLPDEGGYDYPQVDVEALYGAQDRLMADQIAALAPEVPGELDVFALALGGTASQSVFLAEVEGVSAVLDAQYGAGGRTLRLANSQEHPTRYPMANRANLSRALHEIGARQGPEDLTFLFLTSHGKEDLFALSFYEAGTTDLTAAEFDAMLAASGIGPAVIVVSACHSGSFIDDIEGPDRLVITAARGDRTSFGCRDGAEWTEFGASFFDKALREEADPRKAFALATEDVARKEAAEGLTPSLPQISEGADVGVALDRLIAR